MNSVKNSNDTIAAICGGPGGALSIVRISGPSASDVLNNVWHGKAPITKDNARTLFLGLAKTNLDSEGEPCMAVYMPAPRSYTGEDVAELQCHGGDFAPKRILQAVLSAGARHAEPGEFTKRAFLNGKMDLTQAEAVADMISAQSEAACRLAEKQLAGRLGSKVRSAREPLIRVLAEIESRLDFPEEELDWELPEKLKDIIRDSQNTIRNMLDSQKQGIILRDGLRIVIAGSPNVGKSSLLNYLLGFDRAIVTPIPGTTRDTVEETAEIRGIAIRLTDTAGIRDSVPDPVETLGIERSKNSMKSAEIILWLLDASDHPEKQLEQMKNQLPQGIPVIACWNKIDRIQPDTELPEMNIPSIRISALTGSGIDELANQIEELAWGGRGERGETDCAIAARHGELLTHAEERLARAVMEIDRDNWELAASCLHCAVMDLGTVTGENATPDILDEIFSRFCIGK